MSNNPSSKPSNKEKAIPEKALKFLKISPSVKVMELKKSSTVFKPNQAVGLKIIRDSAATSGRPPNYSLGADGRNIMLRNVPKERKMPSVLSTKSAQQEPKKHHIEKNGCGDKQDTRRDVEVVGQKSCPKEKQNQWYTRLIDSFHSGMK